MLASFDRDRFRRVIGAAIVVACCALPRAAFAADQALAAAPEIDAEKFFSAIVKVQTRALPDARSARTLGTEREGTGIVIDEDGLILTIGYLIVEADQVDIVDDHGHTLPARVVGYDQSSGLGLVRPLVPFKPSPLRLGDSGKLAEADPVLVVNHGGREQATLAYVVSRRPFTGDWEYLLDQAIFTSPPTLDWSGAALIGKDGSLLGVGSLILRDATEAEPHVPGNMFVPIDLLKPILPELVRTGHPAGPARPWLGVGADEVQGRLIVTRVSPDGPAERAGLKTGDIILAVGDEAVRSQAELYRKIWGRGAAGSDIPLRLLQGLDVHDIEVHSIDHVDYFRRKTSY
ncbi:MAG TPA: S1C family serine protease [Casimicrobiaceae bacterium]|jgi:S1-C subfamily serine protease